MKNLTPLYEERDFKRGMAPYNSYRKSLEAILDFNQVESFGDFDYSKIDQMDYGLHKWDKSKHKAVSFSLKLDLPFKPINDIIT